MDFPIVDLIDSELGVQWIEKHFHPQGLKCPGCHAGLYSLFAFLKAQIVMHYQKASHEQETKRRHSP